MSNVAENVPTEPNETRPDQTKPDQRHKLDTHHEHLPVLGPTANRRIATLDQPISLLEKNRDGRIGPFIVDGIGARPISEVVLAVGFGFLALLFLFVDQGLVRVAMVVVVVVGGGVGMAREVVVVVVVRVTAFDTDTRHSFVPLVGVVVRVP